MTATLAALALALSAAAAAPPWEAAPPFSADPAEVARAAAALAPPADADVDVLLEEATFAFDERGRATATWRLVYRAVTRDAAARWAEVRRAWAPWHEARPEIRARVVTPDGVAHPLDPATLVEAGLGVEQDGLYGDRRMLQGPLPAADAGVVVEEQAVVREEAPLFEAGAVRRFLVGRDGPVRRVRLRLEAPKGLPLAFALRGGLEGAPRETVEGGRRVLAWSWGPVAPVPAREPLVPPDRASPPHVAFATGRSWGAVAAAYREIVERQLAGARLEEVAKQVVPAGASRVAAAQAVLDWLRGRVRYTGLELGEAALVPARPAQTMERRYGDCKDLSLLAAGVLRAAGFPATLALVRAAGDDPAALPGLGDFDHAIVAVAGEPPLFVDATDPETPAGQLAGPLQGRFALVAAAGAGGLVRLPEAPAAQSRVEASRVIQLPENGWADAREVQELTGWLATEQRAARRALAPADVEEADHELVAAHFVKAAGGAVAFQGLDRPDGPVRIELTGRASHWGITRSDDAEAVVSGGFLLSWLPGPVRPRPQEGGEGAGGATATARAGAKDRPAVELRQGELLLPVAYQGTLRYRVEPPPGFEVQAPLPEPERVVLGPLTYARRFAVEPDGAVTAVHEVTVARRRLEPQEVEGLREGLAPLLEDGPRLRFGRISNRLLEEGKGREALDEIRRLVALHPAEARHLNHEAQALLRLGLGDAARAAARRATELEPGSGWAQRVLATTLEHDALGRWLAPGCDLAGAVAAQRRAVELEKKEPAVRAHLAFLLEHGEGCVRFGEGARLDEAAQVYRAIRTELKSAEHDPALLTVLLRAGRFDDALPVARSLADGPERRAALLAARAATEGPEAAVGEALRIPAGERAAALDAAARHLMLARRYPEAARLLDGASGGTAQSAQLKARAAALSKVLRVETLALDPKDPATLMPRFFRALALGGDAWKAVPEVGDDAAGGLGPGAIRGLAAGFRRGLRSASGMPERVALDAGLSLLESRAEGDPASGLRLVGTMPALASPLTLLVLRQGGGYRLVGTEPAAAGLGAAARRAAEAGDLAAARNLLDLARREATDRSDGKPGMVLAALLPEGREAGREALRLAAAALESFAAPDAVRPVLEAALAASGDPAARRALRWALAAGHVRQGRWADAVPLAAALLAEEPGAARAFDLQAAALVQLGRREELERAVASRLAVAPDDPGALHALVSRAIRADDVADAVTLERRVLATGKATAGDHNNLAWALLFREPLEPEALEEARRAVLMTSEKESAYLHTLATVHAARGEAAEAMQVLRQAVEQGRSGNRPEGADWLVVGLVAERYGLRDEAAAAYGRVAAPAAPEGLSSHDLAQRRLRALQRRAP
jgi:transglutaminase-like putative cysteine protease/Flp pilus assembly protein TadD